MDRKEFLRSGCRLCGCAALALVAAPAGAANEQETVEQLRQRLDGIFPRVAWLMEEMDSALDEQTKARILENVGRRCARQFAGDVMKKYKGNLDGLLEELRKSWGGESEYDRERGTLRWAGPKSDTCPCPLVGDAKAAHPTLCYCSAGFNKELYGTVSGREADVRIEGSIIRRDGRCSFTIQFG